MPLGGIFISLVTQSCVFSLFLHLTFTYPPLQFLQSSLFSLLFSTLLLYFTDLLAKRTFCCAHGIFSPLRILHSFPFFLPSVSWFFHDFCLLWQIFVHCLVILGGPLICLGQIPSWWSGLPVWLGRDEHLEMSTEMELWPPASLTLSSTPTVHIRGLFPLSWSVSQGGLLKKNFLGVSLGAMWSYGTFV